MPILTGPRNGAGKVARVRIHHSGIGAVVVDVAVQREAAGLHELQHPVRVAPFSTLFWVAM